MSDLGWGYRIDIGVALGGTMGTFTGDIRLHRDRMR